MVLGCFSSGRGSYSLSGMGWSWAECCRSTHCGSAVPRVIAHGPVGAREVDLAVRMVKAGLVVSILKIVDTVGGVV